MVSYEDDPIVKVAFYQVVAYSRDEVERMADRKGRVGDDPSFHTTSYCIPVQIGDRKFTKDEIQNAFRVPNLTNDSLIFYPDQNQLQKLNELGYNLFDNSFLLTQEPPFLAGFGSSKLYKCYYFEAFSVRQFVGEIEDFRNIIGRDLKEYYTVFLASNATKVERVTKLDGLKTWQYTPFGKRPDYKPGPNPLGQIIATSLRTYLEKTTHNYKDGIKYYNKYLVCADGYPRMETENYKRVSDHVSFFTLLNGGSENIMKLIKENLVIGCTMVELALQDEYLKITFKTVSLTRRQGAFYVGEAEEKSDLLHIYKDGEWFLETIDGRDPIYYTLH